MKDLLLKDRAIWDLVQCESQKQVTKWGIQDYSPFEWMSFVTEEIGEMAQAIQNHQYHGGRADRVAEEAIQAATLCLKVAEMFISIEAKHGSGGV